MNLLLGTLLLAGVCGLDALKQFKTMPNFDSRKINGKWYPLANIMVDWAFPHYTVKARGGRSLAFSFKDMENNKCQIRKFKFNGRGEPGNFKVTTRLWAQILDTDYKNYIISYIMRPTGSFLALAGRTNVLTPDLEMKLQSLAASNGISGRVLPVATTEIC